MPLFRSPPPLGAAEITPRDLWLSRRAVLGAAAGIGAALATGGAAAAAFEGVRKGLSLTDDAVTPRKTVSTYNNFVELGPDKTTPAENAGLLATRPWTVTVDGECAKPATLDLDAFTRLEPLEERIYRLRCVEGWSVVIPWVGVPLGAVLKHFDPNSRAKFVEFTSLNDPQHLPGQKRRVLDWPYTEALRIDEAMHPLTLLAVGYYGEALLPQSGAPLRLVVPWKYGFKSAKSLVRLRFTEAQPTTTWNKAQGDEYGFYANVNPTVDHPRWSQKRERRLGEFLRRDTLMFNGYADQVAGLYAGMDLARFY